MTIKTKGKKLDPRRAELTGLGARIQRWRRERQLTQAVLAEKLDISVAYVSLIERGGRNPPITTVSAIARALGVSAALLVE
jgi:transcriptional regulator with XRE-family HTH domain